MENRGLDLNFFFEFVDIEVLLYIVIELVVVIVWIVFCVLEVVDGSLFDGDEYVNVEKNLLIIIEDGVDVGDLIDWDMGWGEIDLD